VQVCTGKKAHTITNTLSKRLLSQAIEWVNTTCGYTHPFMSPSTEWGVCVHPHGLELSIYNASTHARACLDMCVQNTNFVSPWWCLEDMAPITPPAQIALDVVFALGVWRVTTAQRCSDVDAQAKAILDVNLHNILDIVPLLPGTRSVCSDASPFWILAEAPGSGYATHTVRVSKYYHPSYWHEGVHTYTMDPCTAVLGGHVLLCVELYFPRSNVILYRDILVSLDEPLQLALATFSSVQGFPADTSYTYLTWSALGGWYEQLVEQRLLAMPLAQVLLDTSVCNSNEVDFFRLTPNAVCESDSYGILLKLEDNTQPTPTVPGEINM